MEPKIYEEKEIHDIFEEYKKTVKLLDSQRWEELQQHIQHVLNKYCVEVAIYNMTAPFPPTSLQENAVNCMTFLKKLLVAKGIRNLDRQ